MSDKQQSAVDWLEERLKVSLGDDIKPLNGFFVIAKELFKQQIIDARTPIISFLNQIEQQELRNESEKYFNETFKTESK